jgi:uncharacterized protein (TIGR03435 family)
MQTAPKLLALILAVPAIALTQTPPAPSSAPQRSSTDYAPLPAFNVISIKPAKPGAPGSGTSIRGDTFIATNVTLNRLIQYQAYGVTGPQIVGIPPELEKAAFDIQAKFDPSAYSQAQMSAKGQYTFGYTFGQLMFQHLLADRFKLAVHTETRELPVYALVVVKSGPKLQSAKDPASESSSSGTGRLKAGGITTEELAKMMTSVLSDELGRVVLDKTGLTGKYDLTLKWTPDMGPQPMLNGEPDTSAPSLFTAIQEQLGLKLESTKGPVPVLVVDHAEMPSEN